MNEPDTSYFVDPWNPKPAEIEEWSKTDAMWPDQDFDLSLATCGHEELLIKVASDSKLAKHIFFVHVLYFMVGDSIYGEHKNQQSKLVKILEKVDSELPEIQKWKAESIELLRKRRSFDYNYWCQHMFPFNEP